MIVDTSAWIDFFNGHDSVQAEHLNRAIMHNEPIVMVGLIYTEILLGLKSDADVRRVVQLLNICQWAAEPNQEDYAQAAKIYRGCRAKGITIRSTIDCLIAQICLRDGSALLTKDHDFQHIASQTSLRLVV